MPPPFVKSTCLAILAMCAMPPAVAPLSPGARLATHARQIARVEQPKPEDAAAYIEGKLATLGYTVKRQQYHHGGRTVRNLEVSLINTTGHQPPDRIFIIGAHYDSARGAPGADDNGSGTAAVLELARMLKGIRLGRGTELKFVFFVNEGRSDYGRRQPELERFYPGRGNFIAFIGTQASAELVRKALAAFRAASPIPGEGLAAASYVEGVTWSDQSAYHRESHPAIMITDTPFLRYPYYHTAEDAPDKLDYPSMTRVVEGLAKVIEGIAAPVRM